MCVKAEAQVAASLHPDVEGLGGLSSDFSNNYGSQVVGSGLGGLEQGSSRVSSTRLELLPLLLYK